MEKKKYSHPAIELMPIPTDIITESSTNEGILDLETSTENEIEFPGMEL